MHHDVAKIEGVSKKKEKKKEMEVEKKKKKKTKLYMIVKEEIDLKLPSASGK